MQLIKKAIIITSSLILLVVLITVLICACISSKIVIDCLLVDKNMPVTIINREMNLNLPMDTHVINFEVSEPGNYFVAKLLLPQNIKIDRLKHKLKKILPGNFREEGNIKCVYPWWDITDTMHIESSYSLYKDVYYNGAVSSHQVHAYICKGIKDGRYYLYINH